MAQKSEKKKKEKIGDAEVTSKGKKKSFFSAVGSFFSSLNCNGINKNKFQTLIICACLNQNNLKR
jgi:hypothetical protein